MDTTAVLVEKVRLGMQTLERTADLHARRYVATMAVALTLAGTAFVGARAGQIPWSASVGAAAFAAVFAAVQIRRLNGLSLRLEEGLEAALRRLDNLIASEVEPNHDGEPPEASDAG